MSHMKMLGRKAVIALSCAGLFFAISTAPALGAQTKSKKAPKTEAASEPSASNPVNLNTGSEQELIDLPGIGPALAKKIIANRPYSSASELSKASVPARTIKKITPMVTTGSASAAAPTVTPATSSKKADSPSTAAPASKPASEPSKSAKKSSPEPQATQAAGGGNGKVWVNTKSGVYHKEGDRWYGRTKEGKYMTEDEANKAGYHLDKQDKKD
jgi:hypothetical protein